MSVRPMQPPDHVHHSILHFCHKKARPVFLGEIANDVEVSLEKIEAYIEYMVLLGEIRYGSKEEVKKMACSRGALLCAITGNVDPKIAHRP